MPKTVKKALITGASRGIGRGIAQALAQENYEVAISYVTQKEEAEKVARIIGESTGQTCHVFQSDLSQREAPARLVSDAIDAMGGLDLLVNNAAFVKTGGDLIYISEDLINHIIDLNFRNYIMCTRAAALYMAKNDIPGNIINITSTRGEAAFADDGIYGGIKAGISRATESFALSLSPYGIRVNCIAPGAIDVQDPELRGKEVRADDFRLGLAQKIPLGRMGYPEDIANAVVWLCSDKASYITGFTLRIDGGLVLPGMPEFEPDDPTLEFRGWGYVKKKDIWEF